MSDLAVVTLATGAVRRIVHRQPVVMFNVSPNGDYLSYTAFAGTSANSQQNHYDLAIVSLATGTTRIVAPRIPQAMGLNMSWSPDGKRLAYLLSSYGAVSNNAPSSGDCFVVAATGGEPVNITPGTHPLFGDAFQRPIWSAQSDRVFLLARHAVWSASATGGGLQQIASVADHNIEQIMQAGEEGPPWSPDNGRSLYVTTSNDSTKQVGFAKIDMDAGTVRLVGEEERAYSELPLGFAAEGQSAYYVAEDSRHAPEIWRVGADLVDRRPITHVNPQFDRYEFGEQQLVHWRSDDGTPLTGALLLPAGYQPGRTYPLVVTIYGGATLSDDVYKFGSNSLVLANDQLLATRGFAVLSPDAPLHVGTPMRDLASAVLPAVNKVIELGIVDPDRLAVMGESYGGYGTIALIAQTPRFRAAVSVAGFSNLISFYGTLTPGDMASVIGWAENGQGRMGGSPWQYRDRYIENSPFFYLDHVATPLLIVHGSLDSAVPPVLGEQTFVALRRLGKDVTYVNYVGEGHGIAGAPNVRDFTQRIIRWLERHMEAPADRIAPASKEPEP